MSTPQHRPAPYQAPDSAPAGDEEVEGHGMPREEKVQGLGVRPGVRDGSSEHDAPIERI